MNINLKKFKKELLFLPLGGSGEIGLNCNLYHYEGKWIMVDCGIGFTKEIPGVDVIVPDISFIKKYKKDLLGIIITHIHEDHLGAIQHLWQELEAPIYTSHFTATFLKEKLRRTDFLDKVVIREIKEGDKIKLKPFNLEFIGLTHSTVEMNAILIGTKAGNILHTGDWKLDMNPVAGKKSNVARLQELGKNKEILATICDSTNIFSEGDSKSESDLLQSFINIISKEKGAVVCATFASNISRVKTLVKAAKACGRKTCLVGSSLLRIAKVGKETGYLSNGIKFVSDKELKKYKKSEIFILATGCQGENLAALNKIANNAHPKIKLSKKDTVIFSSKMIPGNEKSIMKLYNKLAEKDVKIISEANAFVHVSGHYARNDLVKLYKYTKPQVAIATHGEAMHLAEHKRLAEKCGIQKVLKAQNGGIMLINKESPRIIDIIELTNVAVDGKRLIETSNNVIKERKKILNAGIIFINMIIDKDYKLLRKPTVVATGAYDLNKDKIMKEIFEEDISKAYKKAIKELDIIISKKEKDRDGKKKFSKDEDKQQFIGQIIKAKVNKICLDDMGKKPVLRVEFAITKCKKSFF